MVTRDRVIAFMHVSLFKENALGEYRTLILDKRTLYDVWTLLRSTCESYLKKEKKISSKISSEYELHNNNVNTSK